MLAFLLLAFSSPAFAEPISIEWPSRNSRVICGGQLSGVDLKVRVSVPGEVLAAESADGTFLVYIDLHKPGQARWARMDSLSDADFAAAEQIQRQLDPESAALVKRLAATRAESIYTGFTPDGFVHLDGSWGRGRNYSLSCQELKNP